MQGQIVTKPYRALVVDDDAVTQQIILRALAGVDIECDSASTGTEARQYCAARPYDAVVTDLQMPDGNGHELCIHLLEQRQRPIIIVVTGIADPRLTRDLLIRGSADVMYKPVDSQLLAAKVSSLLERRANGRNPAGISAPPRPALPRDVALGISATAVRRLSVPEMESKITILAHLLPISTVACEVADLALSNESRAQDIAERIRRDPVLTAELLKIANNPFYNPTGKKLIDIENAVVRIGAKRIGELALATAALHGLTQSRLPWLDVDLAWRRSVAAGIAIGRLCRNSQFATDSDGLFLSALMHELGRVVLGAVYADEYRAMIAACKKTGSTLFDQEVRVFPITHTDIMARLLAMWKTPTAACLPLKHLAESYYQLERLSEPLRSKIELVKIAVLIGKLAAGEWEPWRTVDVPPAPVLARLNMTQLAETVRETKAELESTLAMQQMRNAARGSSLISKASRSIAYFRMGSTQYDFLPEIIRSMGIELMPCGREEAVSHETIVVSAIGVSAERILRTLSEFPKWQRRLLLVDAHWASELKSLQSVVGIPCSFSVLRQACVTAMTDGIAGRPQEPAPTR